MFKDTPSLESLIHHLSQLPSIGPKSAQRLAYHLLKSTTSYTEALAQSIIDIKKKIKLCKQCFSYTEEQEICFFCESSHRRTDVICVVEDPSDIFRLDSSGAFQGQFHVLHGSISPLEGIQPEDLKIPELFQRIDKSLQDKNAVKEVILALDADLEGDTTALYLAKILNEKGVKVTRIAHGVPIGSDIDYIDYRTLGRALENRVQL